MNLKWPTATFSKVKIKERKSLTQYFAKLRRYLPNKNIFL